MPTERMSGALTAVGGARRKEAIGERLLNGHLGAIVY